MSIVPLPRSLVAYCPFDPGTLLHPVDPKLLNKMAKITISLIASPA